MWTVCAALGNVISSWIVNHTTNKKWKDVFKNTKGNAKF